MADGVLQLGVGDRWVQFSRDHASQRGLQASGTDGPKAASGAYT